MTVPEIKRLSARSNKVSYCVKKTPFGEMIVGACDHGICWMGFDLDGRIMMQRFPQAQFVKAPDVNMEQSLALYGTDFQMDVWWELLKIPDNATTTYGKLAQSLNKPKAYRAVGTAVGMNPISGVIPCHRVLPASGGVGHYLWGADKKSELLKQY